MSIKERIKLQDSICFRIKYERLSLTDSLADQFIANSNGDANKLALAYNFKSIFKSVHSEYELAKIYIDSALSVATDWYLKVKLLKEKAEIHGILNEDSDGFITFHRAQQIADHINDDHLRCELFVSQAEFNRKINRKNDAIDCLHNASVIAGRNHFHDLMTVSLLDRYAAVYTESGKMDSAKSYSLQALNLADELGDLHSMAVSHNELGFIYQHLGIDDSAVYHYDKAIAIWKQIDANIYLVNALTNLGRFYFRKNQNDNAFRILKEAESIFAGHNWQTPEKEVYLMLSALYLDQGDSVGYYKYRGLSTASMYQWEITANAHKMAELERLYEQQENLTTIQNQKRELELSNASVVFKERETSQLILFLTLVTLLLMIVLFLFVRTNRAKREIVTINVNLQSALQEREVLLKEVHHRVKNNLQMISSLLTLQAKDIEDPQLQEALRESQSRVHAMALMHQKLYAGKEYDKVQLADYLEDIVMSLSHSDLRSQDIFKVQGDNSIVHIEQAIPIGFVVHELATNSLKHAWQDFNGLKNIAITIAVDGNKMTILYKDNGSGFPENFTIENAVSMGSQLIYLFVIRQLEGKARFWNDEGANFTFTFKLRNEEANV